eukprot:7381409-Prymnesium_polylepis.2
MAGGLGLEGGSDGAGGGEGGEGGEMCQQISHPMRSVMPSENQWMTPSAEATPEGPVLLQYLTPLIIR